MNKAGLRLVFAGTPPFARRVLEAVLVAGRHPVQRVFTQPDRPAGRNRRARQSAVKQCALQHGLPLLQPENAGALRPGALRDIDLLLVVAYGLLLPPAILATPGQGCVNIHASLLPRWRGAAPIQRAIEAGDRESGITIMQMEAGLDSGPIMEQITCPIRAGDTGGALHERLAEISAEAINPVLDRIAAQTISQTPQDARQASYARKISKQEAELDWGRPALELAHKVRAFNPAPVARARLGNRQARIWEAGVKPAAGPPRPPGTVARAKDSLDIQTGQGLLAVTRLQLPGKKAMSARDFLNGYPDFPG